MGHRALALGFQAALLTALSLTTAGLEAGEKNGKDARQALGRHRVGPLYVTPRFEIRSAGVDSNVYNSGIDPVRDSSALLRPSLGLGLPVGSRLRLTGELYLAFNYFGSEASERSTDRGARGRAELDVSRFTLFGGGAATRSKQRFSIDVDQRIPHREASAFGGARVQLARSLSLSGSATRSTTRFDDIGGESTQVKRSLDRDTTDFSLEARYQLTRQTSFVASSESIHDTFVSQAPGAGADEARSGRHLAGFEMGKRAALSGSALFGVRSYPERVDQAAPPFTGFAMQAAVRTSLLPFGLALHADRDVYYAGHPAPSEVAALHNTYVLWRLGVDLAYEFPLRLLGRAALTRDRAGYLLPVEVAGARIDRVDHFRSLTLDLLRVFGEELRIGGSVSWSRRTSNLPGAAYRATRYGLTLEWTP